MNPPSTRVSIIGAGKVGSTLAQRIAEKNLADVVLLDIVEGWPQGVALDLMQARGVERHDRQIVGTNDYIDTANSNIIVIAAGIPRKPGINREDLIKINARIVTEAAKGAIAHSPEAILIVITNPLDIMTYLAWEAVDLPKHRVMGMGGILDSARFQTFIAMELGVSIGEVCATVIGSHGDLMVPLPRYSTVNGIPIDRLMDAGAIDRIVQRTRHGGAEIVGLMKTASAYFAPASSACLMVESILLNQSRLLPCSVYLDGQYGVQDIFLGVPCRLGYQGVEQVVELELSDTEKAALIESGKVVLQNIEEARRIVKTPDASK
ncbi:MAG: malate dehydrogenase [Microcoleus sp. PH2017_10_PVI_O_A]|uniref:malate dehydrogenase n=1 Tax=unclassified Microcoleus TaxID=2642155 RepID=UPI001D59C0E7|nr:MULTISPECIES: malate dehydrogenase [unclassified Microcoleus]TAE98944.1 MAG: malate dehydrogenase [Oscillatoriales cyanobacterium]MCC3405989.1 malate dehydrogenase [Microcoleus sp. PH2017_10_PVI_O_A]MCC3460018.1 malate dehydrogenase [Microcoleus sp. PH2017_11_PCY_U_A]MCC3478518.1 malate dehydrogenase [Microcoleus sp. PH2017_12_PCY_D_A]MCC3531119.1 malate dehydrogenase [Microcoleus sp. PH2017_21_RUC_O_A]